LRLVYGATLVSLLSAALQGCALILTAGFTPAVFFIRTARKPADRPHHRLLRETGFIDPAQRFDILSLCASLPWISISALLARAPLCRRSPATVRAHQTPSGHHESAASRPWSTNCCHSCAVTSFPAGRQAEIERGLLHLVIRFAGLGGLLRLFAGCATQPASKPANASAVTPVLSSSSLSSLL
jgi:hypothetical protein